MSDKEAGEKVMVFLAHLPCALTTGVVPNPTVEEMRCKEVSGESSASRKLETAQKLST